LVVALSIFYPDKINAFLVLSINLFSLFISLIVGFIFLLRNIPKELSESIPSYEEKRWIHSALPLIFLGGLQIINVQMDTLMLSYLAIPRVAGIYSAAARSAFFITLLLVATNTALSPFTARLYALGQINELQKTITKVSRIVFVLTLPIAALLIIFSHSFLVIIFGDDFSSGYLALSILGIGQLANVGFGPVAVVLNMTGHQKFTALSLAVSAGLNVVLNFALIPPLGMTGAALATSISLVTWNFIGYFWVREKLKVDTTFLGCV
jgi:O-antigen/teichoic acid export membrane protein